jgi:hypothetical protein
LDARVVRLGESERRGLALLYCGASRVNRVLSQFHGEDLRWSVNTAHRRLTVGHYLYLSITFGTRKKVPSASGAFAKADSWDRDFRSPSGISSRFA